MTNTADKNPFTYQDDNPSTIDSGAPIPVAVEYVDSQLNELWRDVAEAAVAVAVNSELPQVTNLL